MIVCIQLELRGLKLFCACLMILHECLVLFCRDDRFGTALIPSGLLKLKSAPMAADPGPIDPACTCFVCKK